MVLMVDDEKVTEQLLQQLLKFLPGPDQMKQLQDMKGVFKDLSDAEQFCAVVSSTGGQHLIATLHFIFIPHTYVCTYVLTYIQCVYIHNYLKYVYTIYSKSPHIFNCIYCLYIFVYTCTYIRTYVFLFIEFKSIICTYVYYCTV